MVSNEYHLSKRTRVKPIKLFFYRSADDATNFGDELAVTVVEHVTGRVCKSTPRLWCELTSVGSVLDKFVGKKDVLRHRVRGLAVPRTCVWGSGLISARDRILPRSHLDFLAVRGELTKAAFGIAEDIPLGDPALLVSEMVQPRAKSHRIGIVPHHTDKDHPFVAEFLACNPQSACIDVALPPMDVVRAIAGCEVIVSSSLHGLIVADALGIPNGRIELNGRINGGSFKFRDYASGIGRDDIETLPLSATGLAADVLRRAFAYQKNCAAVCDGLKRALRARF